MENFEDKYGNLCYFDVLNGWISSKGHAKGSNSKYGFYSASMENNLNEVIETPFSEVVRKLKMHFSNLSLEDLKEPPDLLLTTKDIYACRLFLYSLLARDDSTIQEAKKSSKYYSSFPFLYSDQVINDSVVSVALNNQLEKDELKEYKMLLLINVTDNPFILANVGVGLVSVYGARCYFIPITPTLAIGFIEPTDYTKSLNTKIIKIIIVDGPYADFLNVVSMKQQMSLNHGYVYANNRDSLQRALDDCKKDGYRNVDTK